MARIREIRSLDDLPDWMKELKGFDLMVAGASSEGASDDDMWRISLTLPKDLTALTEHVDPLLTVVVLVWTIGGIEEKIGEVVRFCRAQGRSWTQIGEALGMSKQAAWERFSGED